jgi:ubiquinone biosynthesis monooxygenase Coq7
MKMKPQTNKNADERLSPEQSPTSCTVYFDGACPLCSKEIASYQKLRGAERVNWVDASKCAEHEFGPQLRRADALARLHLRDANGDLVSGAAAFIAMWSQFPALAKIAALLNKRVFIRSLDVIYQLFLRVRPLWRRANS